MRRWSAVAAYRLRYPTGTKRTPAGETGQGPWSFRGIRRRRQVSLRGVESSRSGPEESTAPGLASAPDTTPPPDPRISPRPSGPRLDLRKRHLDEFIPIDVADEGACCNGQPCSIHVGIFLHPSLDEKHGDYLLIPVVGYGDLGDTAANIDLRPGERFALTGATLSWRDRIDDDVWRIATRHGHTTIVVSLAIMRIASPWPASCRPQCS